MKLNVPYHHPPVFTHEGAIAMQISPMQALRRTLMACMLWEDSFYESGEAVAERIAHLVRAVPAHACAALAIEARGKMKLRHAPLLVVREMARLATHKALVADTLAAVIQRPDEITEFLAIYWKDKRQPVSAQVKKGLARAFAKFNEYQFAKYDRDGTVKLRDALFLSHARPAAPGQPPAYRYTKVERKLGEVFCPPLSEREKLYQRIVTRTLTTPDTWEVALSGGADKRVTFERLLAEGKLGALALLRNLRNMQEAGVDKATVAAALALMKVERVLPFRFIAAARAVPQWEDIIEPVMLRALAGGTPLTGKTAICVDTSGSMDAPVSGKSQVMRVDAGCGLAILGRELCADVEIRAFGTGSLMIPPRRGFALRDAILAPRHEIGMGTNIGLAVSEALRGEPDRIIVITDEQSMDRLPALPGEVEGWFINVAAYQNGIGYGQWNHVDGFSEAVFDYIVAREAGDANMPVLTDDD